MRFETRAIHDGQEPDAKTGAVAVPVYQTSTYQQDAIGKDRGFEYSRTGNPTRSALEEAMASLEEGCYGLAFASGLAATTAVISILKKGDHVVVGDDIYGGTYRLFEKVFKKWGLNVTYVPVDKPKEFAEAITKKTKLIWVETPTNPLLKLVDISAVAKIAKENNILLAVDNTFASSYAQKPLLLGADIVVHSTTKYLAGHSDLVGGAVVVKDEKVYEDIKFYQNAAGAVPGPWDVWLTLRGIKTLAVRLDRHQENALYLARFLEKHPKVSKVFYPGLTSHNQHKLAKKQMSGFGGMISIEIKGGVAEVETFISNLKIFLLAESLGGVESLISYPSRMTHASIPEKERLARGITASLVRLSVGIENKLDLKQDLQQALKKIK